MNHFPRGIQNCWRTRTKTCSLPTWKCFLWRSWTSNLYKGCFGETSTWCFASKGIRALSSQGKKRAFTQECLSCLKILILLLKRFDLGHLARDQWCFFEIISSRNLGLPPWRWTHSLYVAPQVELVPDPPRVEPNKAFPSRVLLPLYYNHRRSYRGC